MRGRVLSGVAGEAGPVLHLQKDFPFFRELGFVVSEVLRQKKEGILMRGKVLGVSPQKVDKRGRAYKTIELVVKIPCYSKDVGEALLARRWYDFVLLQKHEFVEITGAVLSKWQDQPLGPGKASEVDVPEVV